MTIGRERPKMSGRGEKIRWLAGNTRLDEVEAARSGHEPHVGLRGGVVARVVRQKRLKTHVAFGCTCMVIWKVWQIVSRMKWLKRVPTDDRAPIAQLPSVKISRDKIYPTC